MRYDRHDAFYAYTATCPYCDTFGEYRTLAEAVQAGVKHSKVCHAAT